jgi:formylmethanofuran dehydrogenase subunit D
MDILITATSMYSETEDDFFAFPYEPAMDPTGDLENDYAIAFLSPTLYQDLIGSTAPNLLIKTYYGQIVIAPEVEEKLSNMACIMPLSPWVYAITPTTLPMEKESFADTEEDDSFEGVDLEDIADSDTPDIPEVIDPILPKSAFNFKNDVSFKAEIEATSANVTSFQEIVDRFFDSERKVDILPEEPEEPEEANDSLDDFDERVDLS